MYFNKVVIVSKFIAFYITKFIVNIYSRLIEKI